MARRGRANLGAGNRLLILGYHRVLPVDEAIRMGVQPGMFVTPETLRMHLSVLKNYVDLIHSIVFRIGITGSRALIAGSVSSIEQFMQSSFVSNSLLKFGIPILAQTRLRNSPNVSVIPF